MDVDPMASLAISLSMLDEGVVMERSVCKDTRESMDTSAPEKPVASRKRDGVTTKWGWACVNGDV